MACNQTAVRHGKLGHNNKDLSVPYSKFPNSFTEQKCLRVLGIAVAHMWRVLFHSGLFKERGQNMLPAIEEMTLFVSKILTMKRSLKNEFYRYHMHVPRCEKACKCT